MKQSHHIILCNSVCTDSLWNACNFLQDCTFLRHVGCYYYATLTANRNSLHVQILSLVFLEKVVTFLKGKLTSALGVERTAERNFSTAGPLFLSCCFADLFGIRPMLFVYIPLCVRTLTLWHQLAVNVCARACVSACVLNLNQPAVSLQSLYVVFMHPFFSLRPKISQKFIHNFCTFLLNYTKFIYRLIYWNMWQERNNETPQKRVFLFLGAESIVHIRSQDSGNFSVGHNIPLKFVRQFQIRKFSDWHHGIAWGWSVKCMY